MKYMTKLRYHWCNKPLKTMFPSLFSGLDASVFQCEVCEISKHRVSFPVSNKFSSIPFSLVHSNVWGPSQVPNCSGAKWFVSFIDDCTRTTWVYLLKDKSEINTILPSFHKMISTQFGSSIKRFRTDNARDYFNQRLHAFF